MIKTVFFDLDGTLLPIDTDKFISSYMKLLAGKFKDIIDAQKLVQGIMLSTELMIENKNPQKTNQEVFAEDFAARVGIEWPKLELLFQEFYDVDFPGLSSYVDASVDNGELVKKALDQGFEVVIATKPIFPKQAVLHRLSWVGADKYDYKLITSYENMHSCKPSLEYYQEILSLIKKEPHECVMIGNDVEEDLVAGQLGIKTVLVTDYMINRSGKEAKADLAVSASELSQLFENNIRTL